MRLDLCLERVRSSGRVLIGGVGDGKLLAGFQWVGGEGVGFPYAWCVGATSVVLVWSAGIGPLGVWRIHGGSLYFVGVEGFQRNIGVVRICNCRVCEV